MTIANIEKWMKDVEWKFPRHGYQNSSEAYSDFNKAMDLLHLLLPVVTAAKEVATVPTEWWNTPVEHTIERWSKLKTALAALDAAGVKVD